VRVGERYVRFRAEAIADWIEAQESPARRMN
jgi:predicted DNA-binding transcriptional regulator AlpA